ncbi:MAG: aldo/keto reductase [Bacteroidales bacterium]|nr:aldo/keto reductase [Bacteroidales bacterium]
MEYRFLGKTGLKVSALSFGAWVTFGEQIDLELSSQIMKAAYDNGVNFFDNAEAYASGNAETVMGKIIKKADWKRSDLVLSTKIFWGGSGHNDRGLSRKHIIEGTDAALERLQTKYVDLIFCHRPDIHTPIEEVVRAMNYVINSGKAFYWGTSEWSAEEIREAYLIAEKEHLIAPSMEQPQYNMFEREKLENEYLRLFKDYKLGTTIWSPLASGILSGKYNNGIPKNSRLSLENYQWLLKRYEKTNAFSKVIELAKIAEEINISTSQMALAWCLKNPNVSTVITGASKPEQVIENLKAFDVVNKLNDSVMQKIDNVLENKPEEVIDWRER